MEKVVSEVGTESANFPQFASVEPHELLSFHPNYILGHLPDLKRYLTENVERKQISLTLKRVQNSGLFLEKTVSGVVRRVFDNYVLFHTNQDVENDYGDEYRDMVIRFDNVLGIIPLIPQLPKEPAINLVRISDEFFAYTRALKKMIDLLSKAALRENHVATLYFRYKSEDVVRYAGNYRVVCKILEANKSNALILHEKSFAYVSAQEYVATVGPYNKYVRYVSPECYLSGVSVDFGKHNINFYAD